MTQNVNIYSDWSHTGQGHVYAAEPVWRDPTCTERGCNMHICTICGEWYGTDFVAAKGHSYTMTVVLPTCTEKGYELYVCVCGDSYKQNFTEAKGHTYGEWIISVPTTCTTDGEHYRGCLSCEDVEREKLSTAGHAYKEVSRTESDCQRHGEVHYSCDVCDAKATEKLELAEHNYQKVHVSKWWLQVLIEKIRNIFFGYEGDEAYYYECGTCGRIRTYDEVSSSGTAGVQSASCNHVLSDWESYMEASCLGAGVEARTCSVCHKAVELRVGEQPDESMQHSYQDTVVKPTCTEPGYTAHLCQFCGDSYIDTYVNALGHDMGAWTQTKAPTCTELGSERRYCANCDHFEEREVAAKGHTYKSVVTKPTCTKQGYITHTCQCGDSYIDTYVAALGHDMGVWTQTKAPTCTEVGSERRDCANCNYFEEREIAAKGHDYKTVVTKPTCTEKGYTTHMCHCGKSYVDSYVDALWHSFGEWVQTKAPTCTEAGSERRDCTSCDHFEEREMAAKGHTYKSVVTKPTCTEQGYTTHTCYCGDSYVNTHVNALGHSMGEWYVVKEATVYENGEERRDCENCEHFETRTVHVDVIWGDATGEGTINGRDLVLLRQYLTKYDYEAESSPVSIGAGGDVNGDGKINGRDLVLLRQYLTKFDYDTGESTVVLGPRK